MKFRNKSKTKQNHKNSGFTLVEMLILFLIMGIITGIISVNSRAGERQFALQRSAQIVTQAVNEAIVMSLGNKEHHGNINPGGYGVFFSKSSASTDTKKATIFANCSAQDNFLFDPSGGSAENRCFGSPASDPIFEYAGERRFELYDLPMDRSIRVTGINPNCEHQQCTIHITFTPPEPEVRFWRVQPGGGGTKELTVTDDDGAPLAEEVEIVLEDRQTGNQISVFINKLGVTRIE